MTHCKLEWLIRYSRISNDLLDPKKNYVNSNDIYMTQEFTFFFVMTSGDCSATASSVLIKAKFISPWANDFATIIITLVTWSYLSTCTLVKTNAYA